MEQAKPTSAELEAWKRPLAHFAERRVGKHALLVDGFELLGDVESHNIHLRKQLEARIIDQPLAVEAIVKALVRSEVRLPNDNRPIACLAFLGPTGVGKSETAKVLAELLGEDKGNLVKIDCSSFSHGHEIASLTGSPPGWIGNDSTPVLSKSNVEKPGTVVLFDEIEKGSPQLYSLMLQIMGDGELKMTNNGEVTSFRDTVIILSSNLGAKEMQTKLSKTPFGLNAVPEKVNRNDLEKTARKSFNEYFKSKPEFTNRLDKEIVFHPLTKNGLKKVLDAKLNIANVSYERYLGVRLTLSDRVKDQLVAEAAENSHQGARPLVRALEDKIKTDFGRYVNAGDIPSYTHAHVYHISEVPENYPNPQKREYIFSIKHDDSIQKASPEELAQEERRKRHDEMRDMLSKQLGVPKEYVSIDEYDQPVLGSSDVNPDIEDASPKSTPRLLPVNPEDYYTPLDNDDPNSSESDDDAPDTDAIPVVVLSDELDNSPESDETPDETPKPENNDLDKTD